MPTGISRLATGVSAGLGEAARDFATFQVKVSLTPDYIELKHALPTAELSVGLSRENPSLGVQYENNDAHGGWTVSLTTPLQAPGASTAKIHRKLEL